MAGRGGKPWSRHFEGAGEYDYIVIGSGMGGMTAAAMLAKLGRRVLVLEQHYVPGGFTHTFRRKAWTWDVGVHAVGEVTRHSFAGRMLAGLTDGRLEWSSLGPVYDEFHFPGGFRIDFPDSPHQFRDNLLAAFPDRESEVLAYLAKVREVAAAMKNYYLARVAPGKFVPYVAERVFGRKAREFLLQRTADALDDITKDPKLRTVLTSQWGYYGSPPSRSSFAMQALVTKHFMHGGYYPVGGSGEIARELLTTVANAGGWTTIHADVKEILIEGGAAVGVRLEDGREVRAPKVVSGAGVASTVTRLLPRGEASRGWADRVGKLPPAPAHVCMYLGFRGDIRSAGASGANKWFYEVWDSEAEAWDISDPDNLPDAPVLYCSFPSLKDPQHDPGPDELHTGEVVTFVPWDAFEPWKDERWRKRGDDYETFKQKLHDAILKQFLRHMPDLRDKIALAELSTPVSTHHFVRPMRGSIYGLEPTPERFASDGLKPRSPIKNLYFAGSDVAAVGVMGACLGGMMAAVAAEPVGGLRYVAKAMPRGGELGMRG